jgi:peptide/nickel transport system substrate-binding protein
MISLISNVLAVRSAGQWEAQMGQARLTGIRRAVIGTLALVVAFGVAACSPAGSSKKSSKSNAAKSTTPFVIARTGDIDLLDPYRATAFQTVQTLGLIYDSLVKLDPQGNLQPGLATNWTVGDGGRTVTFSLRTGVTFHNGEPFGADDVKASMQRLLDPKTSAVGASNLGQIKGVDTPDDHTAVVHLGAPHAALLYALASVNTAILDHKDIAAGTVAQKPNGTGPFRFVSWAQNQKLTLAANPGYWGGAPKLSQLEFRIIPDEASVLAGMRAGSFNLGMISDPSIAKQAGGGNANFTLLRQPAISYHVLMLNGRRPPLDKLAVRQAIACAIDRKQVLDTANFGEGEVTGPITSPAFAASPTTGLPCNPPDLQTAKRLLAQAGFPNGLTLNTLVETGEYATSVNEGQNLQAQLAKVGIRLKLEQQPTSPYVKRWLDADFDTVVALNGGSYDPYLMYGWYFTTNGSLKGPAGLSSPDLDRLLVKGDSATDQTVRKQVYQQLQESLLRLSPWVWTFRGDDYYLLGKGVQGFTAMPNQSLQFLQTTSLGT